MRVPAGHKQTLPVCLFSPHGPRTPSPTCPPRLLPGSPLTQVGHQVDEAHEQEPTHAKHHEQEQKQDGRHRLHSVVAEMPLGEAHVHQLPVEITEGGRSSTQPSPRLLLARAGTPQGGTMAPVEKALEGEDREREMNLEKASVELRYQATGESSGLGWPPPSLPAPGGPHLPSSAIPGCPPAGIPAIESQALGVQKVPGCTPHVLPGRRCPGQRREEGGKEGWTLGQSLGAAISNTPRSSL